jgi:hypothetical protein
MGDGGLDMDAIEARAKLATPGPWDVERRDYDNLHDCQGDRSRVVLSRDTFGGWETQTGLVPTADAEFIAHAREDVPALCARVRELEARRDELLATLARVSRETPYPDELKGWESQRSAMVAEVGTLKARVRELEAALVEAREATASVHTRLGVVVDERDAAIARFDALKGGAR